MLRSGASRAFLRSVSNPAQPIRSSFVSSPKASLLASRLHTLSSRESRRPTLTPLSVSIRRNAASKPPYDKIDREAEAEIAKKKLEPSPELVSADSTIHPVFGEVGGTGETAETVKAKGDVDALGGLKGDVVGFQFRANSSH